MPINGSLIQIAASGKGCEDEFLVGDPEVTLFKTEYKHHTNFSKESVEYEIDNVGLNQKLKFNIPRDGDLLSKMYFKIKATKHFNTDKKFIDINFKDDSIYSVDFLNNSYNYLIVENTIPKKNLLVYKNIKDHHSSKIIYANLTLVDNEIYIEDLHLDNVINLTDNLLYINSSSIKFNSINWNFKLYDKDDSLVYNINNINTNLYTFNDNLNSNNLYKIIINNNIEFNFIINDNIKYEFYSMYPDYIYKFIYENVSDLGVSDIPYSLVDLEYKLDIDKLDFNNILPENFLSNINISNIEILNYINDTKVIITTSNAHNLIVNSYIKIIDNNNILDTPFNKIYKINEVISYNKFVILIDNSYNYYNIINISNIYLEYYPFIKFIDNEYSIYFEFNEKYNISLIELNCFISDNSKISKFDIYGSNDDISINQKNIDNNNIDNWKFIDSININSYVNIDDKLQYIIQFNYYKYYKITFDYTSDSSINSFKYINFYRTENVDLSNKLLTFENNDNLDVLNLNNSEFTIFKLKINTISIDNIILYPTNLENNLYTLHDIETTTNNNGYGLILDISIDGFIKNISVKNAGYNYEYNDLIYVSKSNFNNSSNDLIIKLNNINFININENINVYDLSINSNSTWYPTYNENYNEEILNKNFYIVLDKPILPSYISFKGAIDSDKYISSFNFYGTIWKNSNYNNKIISYSLDLDNNNSLFSIEDFSSELHNSHSSNKHCSSINNLKEHYSIQHSDFTYFNINFITIESSNFLLFDYNLSYIDNINLNGEYYPIDDIIVQFNNKINQSYPNYEFDIDKNSNKLIFKKTNFNLIIINNLLYKLGFSINNKYFNVDGFYDSNLYISDYEIPFDSIEITDLDNSFKLNDSIIVIETGIYSINELISKLQYKISNSEFEVLYLYNKFWIKKKNFTILNSDFNINIKFNNSINNLNFIIGDNNNSISLTNNGSDYISYKINNNYYNINDLIDEIRNLINPINIRIIEKNKIEIYDTDYFDLLNISNNILDVLGINTDSAIFSYINNNLLLIDGGNNYKINDSIKIINPNNNNSIINGVVTYIDNKKLLNFSITNITGNWDNIDSDLLLYDDNKNKYNIKYDNNLYSIKGNSISFINVNSKNSKLYIKNITNDLQVSIIIIPDNIYTPFEIKNRIKNLLYINSYDINFDIIDNKFVFSNDSNIDYSILLDSIIYTNNIIKILGFSSTINLSKNTKIYSNIFTNYVNNNSYYSDININSILDYDIKKNIQKKLGNDFEVSYESNKFSISKSKFSLHYNNYKGFFDKFLFNTLDSNIIDDLYLSNNNYFDCNYSSLVNISLNNPIYFDNNNNIILINNLNKFDDIIYENDIFLRLENHYSNFNLLQNYLNSQLVNYDIYFSYVINNNNPESSELIFKKNNFQIISKNDILPTLGLTTSFISSSNNLTCISDNEPIINSEIFILKNGILDIGSLTTTNNNIFNNNIECKILNWNYIDNSNNRLEIEIISNPLSNNFNFNTSFTDNNNFNIRFSSINSFNAISITQLNNKFYYTHVISTINLNFLNTIAHSIPINNYSIDELLNELQKINSNLKIDIFNNKFRFSYELSGQLYDFKLIVQNDLTKFIIFNYAENTENNIFISDPFNISHINIYSNNSVFRFNDDYNINGNLLINNSEYSINFYNLYSNDNINYSLQYTPNDFANILNIEINKISKYTYDVKFNNSSQFIIKKSEFKIYLYKNNLLNTINFNNRYNNNNLQSNLLTNDVYNINNNNNRLIYHSNNNKYLNIDYYFDNDINITLTDENNNNSAIFDLIVINNKVSNININNGGNSYNINDKIKLNYNNINYIEFKVINIDENGSILEVSKLDNIEYSKNYNISEFVYVMNKLSSYNYLFSYNNSIFNIKKSNFSMIKNSKSILITLNFNDNLYTNNNSYTSSDYLLSTVTINENNDKLIIQDYDNKSLSGKINVINNNRIVSGISSNFINELKKNDFIIINNLIYQIDNIEDNNKLYLTEPYVEETTTTYYYYIKNYTYVLNHSKYSINNFINYFNYVINYHFRDNNYLDLNNKFEILYINNKFNIKKTNFSIINNNDISLQIGFNNTQISKYDNLIYYVESNPISEQIVITNETNKIHISLYPKFNYKIYFTNNNYNINEFNELCSIISNNLNIKSIFYLINFDNNTNKFTISNYKYKFKLIYTPFLGLLGFNNIDYNFSNSFTSNNSIINIINIDNNSNYLNILEKKEINHKIYFTKNIYKLINIDNFIKILFDKLQIIDNGFNVEFINNKFKITNNLEFKINVLSNFINIFNTNTSIKDIISFNFNLSETNKILINEYNNKFYYNDTLFYYNKINNNSNYQLNDIINNLLEDKYIQKNIYINTDLNNNYLYISKTYFNFVFNNKNSVFNLLGYNFNLNNINKIEYESKLLPIKYNLISQNNNINKIVSTNINNTLSNTNKLYLNSYISNLILKQNIVIISQDDNNIRYYVTIIDITNLIITINRKVPNIVYDIYEISNLLSYSDWINNNIPINIDFNITNNNLKFNYFNLELISLSSIENPSIYNGYISDFELYEYIDLKFNNENIKYYNGLNNILQKDYYLSTNINKVNDFISINLNNKIIPYKLHLEHKNINYFYLQGYEYDINSTGDILINSQFNNPINNDYYINYSKINNLQSLNIIQNINNQNPNTISNINLYKNNIKTNSSVNITFDGYQIKPIDYFLIDTSLSRVSDILLSNIIQNVDNANNTNSLKSLNELNANLIGGNPTIVAELSIHIQNNMISHIQVDNPGLGYLYSDILTITNIPGTTQIVKISLNKYLPVNLLDNQINNIIPQTVTVSPLTNNYGKNAKLKLIFNYLKLSNIIVLNNGYGFKNDDKLIIPKNLIKKNNNENIDNDIYITLNSTYLQNNGSLITSIFINNQSYSDNFKNNDLLSIKKDDIGSNNDVIIQLRNIDIINENKINSYKFFKFIFYYDTVPEINILELYKNNLIDNFIDYTSNYLYIDTKLLSDNLFYIYSKNNSKINLPIKKILTKFHYILKNNSNNIFISKENKNPNNFISYNNPNYNISILHNYNSYTKLYYYIEQNINTIFSIPKYQYIFIDNNSILLESNNYTISELINYLNDIFINYDIQFYYNYVTLQLTIYNINDTEFYLYNKFSINLDLKENILIYNNKCIITFKNNHYLNNNDIIYIYSPNISILNNIFIIDYIDSYKIQFDINLSNRYIIDSDIKVYKYSDSFLKIFNILPTINNNINTKYTSKIISNINNNGIVNCIDITTSDVSNIIKNVSFHIGNTKIESRSYKFNDVYNELLLKRNQFYCASLLTTKSLNTINTYYIPLNFWFNINDSHSLPLISLQSQSVFLEIETNSYFGFNTNIKKDTIHEFNILLNYILLDHNERKLFAKSNLEYLITYVNHIEDLPVNNNHNYIQLNRFDNPVKCLIFYLNNCLLSNANISFNEKLRTNNDSEKYYRIIQKYENNINKYLKLNHTLNDLRNWYCFRHNINQNIYDSYIYSFSLNLRDEINPSGTINFSQFKDSHLILNLKNVDQSSSVNIYAITYNILVITNGMGGLKYTK